jgi:hypothetical protein
MVLSALAERKYLEPPSDEAARKALIRETSEAAMPTFDVLMREHAHLRNKEFEQALGHELIQFVAECVVAAAQASGSARQLSDDEISRLAKSVPHDHAAHLAMRPTVEDVTWLAQETARRLVQQGLLSPDVDVLRDVPNPLVRATDFLHSVFGGTDSTFFTRLHQAVVARHQERWREHLAELDDELTKRGGAIFTRLALEEILIRANVTDPEDAGTPSGSYPAGVRTPPRHVHDSAASLAPSHSRARMVHT